MKLYLVFETKKHFTPEGEVTFDGITRIVGIFDDPDKAGEMAQKAYEDHYHYLNEIYVGLGDYDDINKMFTFDPDRKLIKGITPNGDPGDEFQWEIKEVELNEEL